jgi:hypothetical protein
LNHQTRRHLFVAVDAKDYSRLDATAQQEAQAALMRLLEGASQAAGLDRLAWSRQQQGDGELALVPADQAEELVVDGFVRELDALLDRYNRVRLPDARLRLRMALHHGVGFPADNGYAGPAPVVVSRLLASDQLHDALAEADGSDLVVALSDTLYSDVILARFTSLRPEVFAPADIVTKKYQGRAWIRVVRREGAGAGAAPRQTNDPDSGADCDQEQEQAQAQAQEQRGAIPAQTHVGGNARVGVINNFGDNTRVGVAGISLPQGRR